MLQQSNQSNLTLPTVRLILGILGVCLSLIFSIQFIAAGASGIAIVSAIIFAVIFEFAKTMALSDCQFYWATNQGSKALFSALLTVLLFALSIAGAVYVLSINPSKEVAIISQDDKLVSQKQAEIAAKQVLLDKCPAGYISKCQKPLNDQISKLSEELNQLMKSSNNTLSARANQEFWKKLADYVGSDSNMLQMNFAFARSIFLEVISLMFIAQYVANKRLQSYVPEPQQIQPTQAEPPATFADELRRAQAEIARLQAENKQLEEKKEETH